jgi:hypothetical protein
LSRAEQGTARRDTRRDERLTVVLVQADDQDGLLRALCTTNCILREKLGAADSFRNQAHSGRTYDPTPVPLSPFEHEQQLHGQLGNLRTRVTELHAAVQPSHGPISKGCLSSSLLLVRDYWPKLLQNFSRTLSWEHTARALQDVHLVDHLTELEFLEVEVQWLELSWVKTPTRFQLDI